jgi:hypothetical protein
MIIENYNESKTEILKTSWKFNNCDQEYILSWSICETPFCSCTEITFGIGLDKNPPIASFSYDINTRKCSNVESIETSKLLTEQLISELTDNDYATLNKIFYNEKIRHIDACNLNEIDPPPFPVEEIENESLMVDFKSIFPWALQLWFQLDDITYYVIEQYCLNSTCKCNDIHIDFFAIKDDIHLNKDNPTTIIYNFITGKWSVEEHGQGTHQVPILIKQMYTKYPEIKETFADRKSKLKLLYRRYREKEGLLRQEVRKPIDEQCGRNDPCFCGSGKKYKKCCGK